MPADSIFVSICVVAMFSVLAVALYWGDRQTRPQQLAVRSSIKHRAF
jgi:hypothetical protein